MAEEEEKPEITDSAVATAEPPKPPIPEDESVPEEKPEDAAAAEGEAPPADETPDEDVPLADLIVQAQAVNPELVDDLISKLPEEDQAKYRSSDTERAALEAEQSQLTRTTQLNTATAAYQPYSQPISAEGWRGWADEIVRDMQGEVRKIVTNWKGDGTDNLDVLPDDFVQRVTGLANYGNNLRATQEGYLAEVYQSGLMAALTAHSSYQLLPKEVRAETDVVKLLQAQLDAAGQADPKGVKKALKAEVEAELGAQEKQVALRERLQKVIGGNGRKATQKGTPTKGPATREEVEEALRTGPTKDIDANLAKLAALEGS